MSRFRALAATLVLAAAGLFPVATASTPACAATVNSAALVVDTGGSATAYCVELPSGSVDGLDLIKLAAKQYGLSYNLGFGGQAVCALDGVGVTDSSDCFAQMPDYWGLWIGNGSGGWNWASVGAGSISVGPGDVQGWAWGSGKDGSSHPAPPDTDYQDVCKVKDTTDPGGSNGGTGGGGGGGTGAADGGTGADTTPGDQPRQGTTQHQNDPTAGGSNHDSEPGPGAGDTAGDRPDGSGTASGASRIAAEGAPAEPVEASPVALAAPLASGGDAGTGGPPLGAIAVLGIVAMLGAGGMVMSSGSRGGRHRAGHLKRKA